VVLDFTNVFAFHQTTRLLFIYDAVVVLEEQVKVGRGGEDGITSGVRASPDFLDDIFGELGAQEADDGKSSDQVESISIVDIFFEEEVPHLLFAVDMFHILGDLDLDPLPNGFAPHLELLKLIRDKLKNLDQ
jgi:hypothetical protein